MAGERRKANGCRAHLRRREILRTRCPTHARRRQLHPAYNETQLSGPRRAIPAVALAFPSGVVLLSLYHDEGAPSFAESAVLVFALPTKGGFATPSKS